MTEMNTTPQNNSKKTNTLDTLKWVFGIVLVSTTLLFVLQWVLKKPPPNFDSQQTYDGFEPKKGAVAPDFVLHQFRGESQNFSSLEGRLVLVNFWATWCTSCVIEIPSILKLKEEFESNGLRVVFVSVDDMPEKVLPEKLEELKVSFPTYIDRAQNLSDLFDVSAIPLTLVLNQKREILYIEPGERDWHSNEVRNQIKQWLSE